MLKILNLQTLKTCLTIQQNTHNELNYSACQSTPARLSKNVKSGLLLVLLVSVQGCSTFDSGVNALGGAVDSLETSLQTAFVDIEVKSLSEQKKQQGGFSGTLEPQTKQAQEFYLSRKVSNTVNNLDNRAMHAKAKTLCQQGYVKLSEQAISSTSLKETTLECVSGNCHYDLHWHIRCHKLTEEPFTLFGKT